MSVLHSPNLDLELDGHHVVLQHVLDQAILDRRCDKRVDKMIERGMVKDLEDFHEVAAKKNFKKKKKTRTSSTMAIFFV